jgi:hypothetical protein
LLWMGGSAPSIPGSPELCNETYWPQQRLDPAVQGSEAFLRLANELVKRRSGDPRPL